MCHKFWVVKALPPQCVVGFTLGIYGLPLIECVKFCDSRFNSFSAEIGYASQICLLGVPLSHLLVFGEPIKFFDWSLG